MKFYCKKCNRKITIETDKPIDLQTVKCSICGNKIEKLEENK